MSGRTCGKLLDGHEGEADERQGLAQDLALVLGRGLELLPLGLGVRPAHRRPKQTHLPHPEGVPLQHGHQGVCRGRGEEVMSRGDRSLTGCVERKN